MSPLLIPVVTVFAILGAALVVETIRLIRTRKP